MTDSATIEKAEDLISYWQQHGDNEEVVAKWAVEDLLKLARMVTGEYKAPEGF